jgi:hypothetical protein
LTLGRSADPNFSHPVSWPDEFAHEFREIKFNDAGARNNRKAGTENAK